MTKEEKILLKFFEKSKGKSMDWSAFEKEASFSQQSSKHMLHLLARANCVSIDGPYVQLTHHGMKIIQSLKK